MSRWFVPQNNPKYEYFLTEISVIYDNPTIITFYEKNSKIITKKLA